ncbi:MAG TPA: glycosyltransferase [Actinomycetota bacterium]|nr:glycosyltransferase [Actinomycetota bacterium]
MAWFAWVSTAALLLWAYLVLARGHFWVPDQTLPALPDPARWPAVAAVVPARDEAALLPRTLPTLLSQRYPGPFRVVLVDDRSRDGTAEVARALGAGDPRLTVVRGTEPPPGWAGKVWAMAQGLAAAGGGAQYVLFTDADVAHGPDVLASLVRAAEARGLDLVSQMARLHADSFWERLLIPAFVYFFAQLYPFRWVNRPDRRTAAAAGGCLLVRLAALREAGGLEAVAGALIDDVALARLLKPRSPGGTWLGHGRDIRSLRPHPRLRDVWDLVARTAYTELRHSPLLLVATAAGLLFAYALPPLAALTGLAATLASPSAASRLLLSTGAAAWALMALSYAPTARSYGLSSVRGLVLPAVALLYLAMTVDSALRHLRGRGGLWKGRTAPGPRTSRGPGGG